MQILKLKLYPRQLQQSPHLHLYCRWRVKTNKEMVPKMYFSSGDLLIKILYLCRMLIKFIRSTTEGWDHHFRSPERKFILYQQAVRDMSSCYLVFNSKQTLKEAQTCTSMAVVLNCSSGEPPAALCAWIGRKGVRGVVRMEMILRWYTENP
jgi:hypothetical protein